MSHFPKPQLFAREQIEAGHYVKQATVGNLEFFLERHFHSDWGDIPEWMRKSQDEALAKQTKDSDGFLPPMLSVFPLTSQVFLSVCTMPFYHKTVVTLVGKEAENDV